MARLLKQPVPHEVRMRQIIDLLETNEHVFISDMANRFLVSEITVRRDLDELEKQGLLFRTHGGAIRNKPISKFFTFDSKASRNQKEKLEICRYAVNLIEEDDILFMDCGTTVYYLARFLSRFNKLRVITNSLSIVSELIQYSQVKVHLIGGELDQERRALYGATAESLLHRLRATKAFIGAAGISLEHGLSSNDEKEAITTSKMAETAQKVYVLCDSTKFDRDAYITYAPISVADMVITDRKLDMQIFKKYRDHNVNIVFAEPE